jgi:hypothetical protein
LIRYGFGRTGDRQAIAQLARPLEVQREFCEV